MTFLKIAFGNLKRNRRRTLSTIAVICVGVSMMALTNGFTDGVTASMSGSLVNQIDGHLRIEHRDYKKYAITDQEKILIKDFRELADEVGRNPHVIAVMPRVLTGGLIGKDDKSTTFFATISSFETLSKVLPDYANNLTAGEPLLPADPDGVLIGKALAQSLALNIGDEVALLSKTVHGEQSSALAHIRGIVTFPQDPIVEQSLIVAGMGKSMKENLLDIGEGATQLLVRLDDINNVPEVAESLNRQFESQNLPWRVVPWYESKTYSQIVGMLNGINVVIMFILALMLGVITSNALLMAFFERINEIGSLRAIGMRKLEIRQLLYYEAAITGAVGTLAGLALGAALIFSASHFGVPLGSFLNQLVRPTLTAISFAASAVVPIIAIMAAATAPIRLATRMSVIESLNYR
ncbi:MAG: ABC transporter permease [Nitrospinae bacterium]|nr:ABC transporter permease [Nitrospinota bacterium]